MFRIYDVVRANKSIAMKNVPIEENLVIGNKTLPILVKRLSNAAP